MKKFFVMAFMLFSLTALAACSGNSDTPEPSAIQNPTDVVIEELGATIASAGAFWDDWWFLQGTFEWEHIDSSQRKPWSEATQNHPLSRRFDVLLPSSGFESINDISVHLLQFYTQSWVDRELFGEGTAMNDINDIFFGSPYAFEEYNGILYIDTYRFIPLRPNWATATHTIIEQDGNRIILETTVTAQDNLGSFDEMPIATFNFIFIDGRIESGLGQWVIWPETGIWSSGRAPRPHEGINETTYVVYHGGTQRQHRIFIDSTEFVPPILFSNPHTHIHDESGDGVVIWARQEIYDISVITFEPILGTHDHVDEVLYRMTFHYPHMASALLYHEVLYIRGITGQGSYPNMGIAFTTADNERHYFAIMHDHSESPYPFIMWDITDQIQYE